MCETKKLYGPSAIGSRIPLFPGRTGEPSRLTHVSEILGRHLIVRSIIFDVGSTSGIPAKLTVDLSPSNEEALDGPMLTLSLEFAPSSLGRMAARHLFGDLGSRDLDAARFSLLIQSVERPGTSQST